MILEKSVKERRSSVWSFEFLCRKYKGLHQQPFILGRSIGIQIVVFRYICFLEHLYAYVIRLRTIIPLFSKVIAARIR